MKIKNISEGKIIGLGSVTLLPGQTEEVDDVFADNPAIPVYEKLNYIVVTEKKAVKKAAAKTETVKADDNKKAKEDADKAAEALRVSRLASLDGISDENLAKLALDLGIGAAECKDTADMLAKVKAKLTK